jgi:hypothetical protein
MLVEAFRYPLGDRTARDAFVASTGLVILGLVLLRVGAALWPDVLAVVPVAAVVVPASLFAGYLGRVLRADPSRASAPSFVWSRQTLRVGVRVLAVVGAYLVPAGVALLLTAFVLLSGGSGALLTLAPTGALLLTVVSSYLLPAAVAAAVRHGLRAGFSRSRFAGLASGSYFFAWTVAVSVVVVVWSVLAAVREATPLALASATLFAYGHVVAARLLGDGLARSPWAP